MTLTHRQFFTLLRSGLWSEHSPDLQLFSQSTDWETLYMLARQQTVTALVWDGIQKLPNELFPPTKLRMQWLGVVVQIERTNRWMNEILTEVIDIYEQQGLHPVLLKGQSMAANYPNPLHRECGDIDLFFCENEYERAKEIAQTINTGESHESKKHLLFTYKGVSVENHRYLVTLYNSKRQKWIDYATQSIENGQLPTFSIEGKAIKQLPFELNVHFIFIHLYHHFMVCGLGLRQICDWCLLLDKQSIERYTPYIPLIYWQLFGDLAVQYLGLDPKKVIHHRSFSIRTSRLLEQIIKDGNFGKNDLALQTMHQKGFFVRKMISFSRKFHRYPRFITLSPIHSLPIIVRYIASTTLVTLQKKAH